jgi:hypothetical protein
MAKLTWLGEDELHGSGAGPSFTHAFGGIKFPKGQEVEVRAHAIVQKALNNQFFEVEDADEVDDAPVTPPVRNKGGRPRKEVEPNVSVNDYTLKANVQDPS